MDLLESGKLLVKSKIKNIPNSPGIYKFLDLPGRSTGINHDTGRSIFFTKSTAVLYDCRSTCNMYGTLWAE